MYGSKDETVDTFASPLSVGFNNLPLAFAGAQQYFVVGFILVSFYAFVAIFSARALALLSLLRYIQNKYCYQYAKSPKTYCYLYAV